MSYINGALRVINDGYLGTRGVWVRVLGLAPNPTLQAARTRVLPRATKGMTLPKV